MALIAYIMNSVYKDYSTWHDVVTHDMSENIMKNLGQSEKYIFNMFKLGYGLKWYNDKHCWLWIDIHYI